MATNMDRIVQLEQCYLKDGARYRELADVGHPRRSIRAWREKLANLTRRGTDVFFVAVDGTDKGFVHRFCPLDLPDWNIVYLSVTSQGVVVTAREVSGQLFRMNPSLYRVDVYSSSRRVREERGDDNLRADVCKDTLSSLSSLLEHRTYFSPDLDDRQVAFIPWEFGYIAIATNAERNMIESVSFVRGHISAYDVLIRKAAFFAKIVDDEGFIVTNGHNEPIENESDILIMARKELTNYLRHAHIPKVDYEFPHGTPFQERVWRETEKIPFGSVKTYSELAHLVEPDPAKAGRLARAVGQALSANPLPILIPCHRVIGANRDLTGFSGGVDIKEHLLQMEMWKMGGDVG